jgi:hypothetical protein
MRRYPSWKELQKITKVGRYAAGDGLYMQVAPGSTRSWIFRYRRGDKSYHVGLGSCRYLSLAEARQKAIDAQRQRMAGLDPLTEKRKSERSAPLATNVPTFERAAGNSFRSVSPPGATAPAPISGAFPSRSMFSPTSASARWATSQLPTFLRHSSLFGRPSRKRPGASETESN